MATLTMRRLLTPSAEVRLRRYLLGLPSLIALYPLDDSVGSATVRDIGPNKFHLTVDGATLGSTAFLGRTSVSVDGVNDKLGSADVVNNTLCEPNAYTLFAIIRASDVTQGGNIINYTNSGVTRIGYELERAASAPLSLKRTVLGGTDTASGPVMLNNTWHCVVATWDGTTGEAYTDGVAGGAPFTDTNIPSWVMDEELNIGANREDAIYTEFVAGNIRWAGYCGVALSQAQITQMTRLAGTPRL